MYSCFHSVGLPYRTLAEAVEPDVKFGAIVAALFDEDGKPVSHWSATAEEMARKPVVGAMPAPTAVAGTRGGGS